MCDNVCHMYREAVCDRLRGVICTGMLCVIVLYSGLRSLCLFLSSALFEGDSESEIWAFVRRGSSCRAHPK